MKGRYEPKTYTINGETMTLRQFSEKYGISQETIRARLNLGWDDNDIFAFSGSIRHIHKKKRKIDAGLTFQWTKSSIECYENGCTCSKCQNVPEFFKPQCKMKKSVLKLVKLYGSPENRYVGV